MSELYAVKYQITASTDLDQVGSIFIYTIKAINLAKAKEHILTIPTHGKPRTIMDIKILESWSLPAVDRDED